MKFNYLAPQLEPEYIENIWGILSSNSATKYSETRLLDLFKKSESTLIKKIISEIDLGNLKPNQLLQKLKSGNRCVTSWLLFLAIFCWRDFQIFLTSINLPKYSSVSIE